ncbi:aminoimidazole riboside kinase [Vibrio sp. DW001]|uniref:aminoimidazole riboside kinase n=1 Tax=Vibrio sp. DW001 TaxID=2912315 RepID=UPI0023B10503|nr:aminoimidazole riboside kinase [Vibrio sp. DW001]WED29914.1 aminoimidazole riboside kinase [Vibrio sp. DW001]
MNRIWLSGDAVVDLIPDSETTYLKCPGGAPANVAVATSRLGNDCAFFGRVGNDPLGRFMRQTLQDEGVNIENLLLDEDQRTSMVIVDLDDNGERSFTFMVKPSADQFLQTKDIPKFQANQWLHLCSISLANEPSRSSMFEAIERIRSVGGNVSFDPNLRDEVWADPSEIKSVVLKALAKADVVKFSEEELLFLTDAKTLEQGIKQLEKFDNTLVLITMGAKGALVIHDGSEKRISGRAVSPVDTTGAGDAFIGGLLARLAQSNNWSDCEVVAEAVLWGNGCGALAITKKGAMTALPTKEELMKTI